jgi:hypothetical protein
MAVNDLQNRYFSPAHKDHDETFGGRLRAGKWPISERGVVRSN